MNRFFFFFFFFFSSLTRSVTHRPKFVTHQSVVAQRLSALERALADLRVRGVLEQQVEVLSSTKGDASVFTAQLGMLSGELRAAIDGVRKEAAAVAAAEAAAVARRQDEAEGALRRFAKGVEDDRSAVSE